VLGAGVIATRILTLVDGGKIKDRIEWTAILEVGFLAKCS
jgi:hypothetical protein